jgi:hypothetical protein
MIKTASLSAWNPKQTHALLIFTEKTSDISVSVPRLQKMLSFPLESSGTPNFVRLFAFSKNALLANT